MKVMMVTDFGSYLVDEDKVEEFKRGYDLIYELDYEKNFLQHCEDFDKKWGNDKITPLAGSE